MKIILIGLILLIGCAQKKVSSDLPLTPVNSGGLTLTPKDDEVSPPPQIQEKEVKNEEPEIKQPRPKPSPRAFIPHGS
jgi:hypothetical protein